MERFALLISVIAFMLSPMYAHAQNVWQDDGLVWINLILIDQDAPGGPKPLHDAFVEPCTPSSPSALSDWMPHGFRQDRTEHHRVLGDDQCERVLALRVQGHLNWSPVHMIIPWQPGEHAMRDVGVPREGAGRLMLRFPDALVVGVQAYHVPDPVTIAVGKDMRSTSVVVPMRRLARAVVFEPVDDVVLDRFSIPHDVTTHFLLPGERLLQTDAAHRLHVVAIDPRGRRHDVTDPRAPSRFVNVSAAYGWTFEVEVLPPPRSHRDWVASLRSAAK